MEPIEGLLTDLETPKRFSPQQLKAFTACFSTSLGSGAFGDVFKGVLHDGVQVAVKVLKGEILSNAVKDQFKAEVSVLGKIHHKNVVKLYGFCFERDMKALLYEFMENESLEKQLYGNQTIAWETLCNIAVGTAKGLAYLHEDCQPRILHYDIKPANILLDSKFSPKVGDFGLAKLLGQDTTHISEIGFRGTPNYAAPELCMPHSSVTNKCDVYSFGTTLFDIIGRKRHVPGEGQKWFPVQVWKKFKEEKQEEIIQECDFREKNRKQAKRILLIALQCVQPLPGKRPSMSRVVRLLEGTEEVKLPPYPFPHIDLSSAVTEEDNIFRTTVKASSSFTKEVKLPPNPFLMHMGSSSVITKTLGPWGGSTGHHWDDGIFAVIKMIKVFKGRRGNIHGIQVWYCGKDGESISSRNHGFRDVDTMDKIELDYPSEYLMRVTGVYGYEFGDFGFVLVKSLCFFTNKKIYGPFGNQRGTYFTSEKDGKDGKVVGFHGRCGPGLDAIGIHMEYNKDHQEKLKENDAYNVTRIKHSTVGPWGGDGGDNWDDGVYPGIKNIKIYKGIKGDVRSMQIGYYCGKDGDPSWSHKHGYKDIHTTETIELDYPSEYLVRVTGSHCYEYFAWGRIHLVRSLCFFSNKKKYGPFGTGKGSSFSTMKDGKDGKVIGFHGRAGMYLNAIGMHMDYSS